MDDVRTVLRAVDSERAGFFGCHLGGRLALLFAAAHPEQTTAVVTFGSHPATLRDPDYPWGTTPEERAAPARRPSGPGPWTPPDCWRASRPASRPTPSRRWWSTLFASAATPPESIDEITSFGPVDIRRLLGAVHTPTLVLHRDRGPGRERGGQPLSGRPIPRRPVRRAAGRRPPALCRRPGQHPRDDQEFLTGTPAVPRPTGPAHGPVHGHRGLHARRPSRLGDRRWRLLLEEHDEVVRESLAPVRRPGGRHGRRRLPDHLRRPRARDPRCGCVRAGLAEHGIPVRAGLHTGEVELAGARSGASRCTWREGRGARGGKARSCAPAPSRTSSPGPASLQRSGSASAQGRPGRVAALRGRAGLAVLTGRKLECRLRREAGACPCGLPGHDLPRIGVGPHPRRGVSPRACRDRRRQASPRDGGRPRATRPRDRPPSARWPSGRSRR